MIYRPLLLTLALVIVPALTAPGEGPAAQEQSPVLPHFSLALRPPQPEVIRPKIIPPDRQGWQSPPRPTITFEEMIAGGKREEVVAMLVAAIRNLSANCQNKALCELAPRTWNLDYGLGRASYEANRLGIEDDVVRALASGPDRRLQALLLYRMANRQPEALVALRAVHAEMPADPFVAMAFFKSIPEAEFSDWSNRFREGNLPAAEASGFSHFLSKGGRQPRNR